MRIGRLLGKRALTIAILLSVISVGCGNRVEDARSQPEAYSDFLAYMRQIESDYNAAETPKALARDADAVVVGRIVDVQPGQSYAPGGDEKPVIATSVLKIDVQEVVAGGAGLVYGGFLYVEVPHPAYVGTGDPGVTGEGLGATVPFDHAAFAAAVPRTNGVFFVADRTNEPYWKQVFDEGAGRPAGASLTTTYVQGFLIEDAEGKLLSVREPISAMPDGWHGLHSISEIAQQASDVSG